MKRLWALFLLLAVALLLSGCRRAEPNPYEGVPNPIATITLQSGKVMRAELSLQEAPNTVANFTELANAGFYDGLEVFRVVPGALVQTGDPRNNGTGGPGYAIRGEFAENGYKKNTLTHARGALSMARTDDYDSAGSQFFIMQGTFPEYDGKYAAFGKLMDEESLQALDSVASVAVDAKNRPLVVTKIESIRVDTHGHVFSVVRIGDEQPKNDQNEQGE